jgi:hypothetical protein
MSTISIGFKKSRKVRVDPSPRKPLLDPVKGYPDNQYYDDPQAEDHDHRRPIRYTSFFTPGTGTYYSEPNGIARVQLAKFPTLNHKLELGFADQPSRPPGWFGTVKKPQYMTFETTLVGISDTEKVVEFRAVGQTFFWKTNGKQTSFGLPPD